MWKLMWWNIEQLAPIQGVVSKYPGKPSLFSHHLGTATPQRDINNSVRNLIIFLNYPHAVVLENCSLPT